MTASSFIRPMHPKTEISPLPEAIARTLAAGWIAQLKIHGHRAQIHIPADPDKHLLVFNRHGKFHKKKLPPPVEAELRRVFKPERNWNVIDAEWIKGSDKIFIFDFIKKNGELLRRLTFPERFALLPRLYLSPYLSTLPLIKDLKSCLEAMQSKEPYIEGLVFKSTTSTGFSDTSIVRCRIKHV